MKAIEFRWGAVLGILFAASSMACGASDGETEEGHGGSSAGGARSGGAAGNAGGGQSPAGGASGSPGAGASSGGMAGSSAGGTGGSGGRAMGGGAGAGAASGGASGSAGRGGAGVGGAPGGWTCENFGAEICFCRLGGDPLMGTSCTGSWNCCFVTGTAERGNCQCFDTASDSECSDTIATVTGTRAEVCPP